VRHVIEQRSLETHVKGQQLTVEERAQMAYHATEAVDALLAGIDANFPEDEGDERLANERASLLALLYRDIQQSHNWLVPFLNLCCACAVARVRSCVCHRVDFFMTGDGRRPADAVRQLPPRQ
jgi:hypothetical protein